MSDAHKDSFEQIIAQAIRDNADSLSLGRRHHDEAHLPKTLLDIPNLRHLCMENCYVDIPAWLADIPTLETLEVEEGGDVREIMPLLWKLGRLRTLKLAFVDGLTELPSSLAKLTQLEELNVDGADLGKFPPVIASLASLQSFSYQYCDCALPEVFDVLSALPNLKKLRLTHSSYDGEGDFLPESFCRLQAIEELDFSEWNELRELPECIGGMQTLRAIDLSNSDRAIDDHYTASINELPDSLGNLCNFEALDVYGLQDLKQFPASFSRLARLKRLNTMDSGIEELKLTPQQWNNLEELRMHGTLPDFRQLTKLKQFAWAKKADAHVSVFPDGKVSGTAEVIHLPLQPLGKLESLSIYGGKLDSPDFLASLRNLRTLHLSCDFEGFPAGFEKLDKLEEINIWGAKSLTVLPEYLGAMPALKRLSLTACNVERLPKSVLERKDLRIDVEYCPFKYP